MLKSEMIGEIWKKSKLNSEKDIVIIEETSTWVSSITSISFSLFNLLFFHILPIISLFNMPLFHIFLNILMIRKIWKKSKFDSDKIWKIRKKSKSNSDKIWKI
jgi:hypothetical protein